MIATGRDERRGVMGCGGSRSSNSDGSCGEAVMAIAVALVVAVRRNYRKAELVCQKKSKLVF